MFVHHSLFSVFKMETRVLIIATFFCVVLALTQVMCASLEERLPENTGLFFGKRSHPNMNNLLFGRRSWEPPYADKPTVENTRQVCRKILERCERLGVLDNTVN